MMKPIMYLAGLFAMLVMNVSAQTEGLTLLLDLERMFEKGDHPCGRLTCRAEGEFVDIESVRISMVKEGTAANTTAIISVTLDKPEKEVATGGVRGNGTLESNAANLYLDVIDVSACDSDYFTCTVAFTKQSGEKGTAFSMTGPGSPPGFQCKPQAREENQTNPPSIEAGKSLPQYRFGSPYTSELWFLGDKITKVEGKFETLRDRLDRRMTEKIEAVQKRSGALENSVMGRLVSVETDFSTRVSRLEDRVSSHLLSESGETRPETDRTLVGLESRLDIVSAALEKLNVSLASAQKSEPREEEKEQPPQLCEPGMGDDLTKSYSLYIVVNQSSVQRNILCDTHTDGGGWLVIQRRAKGDVEFFRDWTSYRDGFGSPTGDHWLGNEAVHKLTDEHPYTLRIDMRIDGQELFAEYSSFRVEDESDNFRLRLGSYYGTAGQTSSKGLTYHNNAPFSTFDRDNDANGGNCATMYHGAWWYKTCHTSNLNGLWGIKNHEKGVNWDSGKDRYPSFTEMKIRRILSKA